jgi:hypothetical protein
LRKFADGFDIKILYQNLGRLGKEMLASPRIVGYFNSVYPGGHGTPFS